MGNAFRQCCESQNASKLSEISLYSYYTSQEKKNQSLVLEPNSIPNPTFEKHEEYTLSNHLYSNPISGKALVLKVINSGNLDKGISLNILTTGLEKSKRNSNDGIVYFGCKRKQNGHIVNDFVIPIKEKELSDQHRGRHFLIYYSSDKQKFYIKDLAIGFGAFMRVDSSLVLKDNYLLNIGESFFVISLAKDSPQLNIKVFGVPFRGQIFSFLPENHSSRSIFIGRNFVCDIKLEDALLSKVQCTINWDEIDGWKLRDGNAENCRPSTNGTWLYLSEEMQIYQNMVIKASQTVFQVSLLDNKTGM